MINDHRVFASGPTFPGAGPHQKNGAADLNRQLARLLGWTNFAEAGGALLGQPPDGAKNSRGQAAVPDWCGDWAACGPLLGRYNIAVDPMSTCVAAGGVLVRHREAPEMDDAVRRAIVLAVIARLEKYEENRVQNWSK